VLNSLFQGERAIKKFLCLLIVWVCSVGACAAGTVDRDITSDVLNLTGDFVVSLGTRIGAGKINIGKSMILKNLGTIDANINVCRDCVLYFQNNGNFSGTFGLADGAKLIQVVSTADDLRHIVSDSVSAVMVAGADGIAMSDIAGVVSRRLIFDNAKVVLDTTDLSFVDLIELRGETIIVADEKFTVPSGGLTMHVAGDGSLHISGSRPDALMGLRVIRVGDMLYINYARETDYVKIFGNSTGAFLNDLRRTNPGDKLLRELDGARNMDELHHVMQKSVRLNPMLLMRMPRIIDRLETTPSRARDGGSDAGPFYVRTSDASVYGVRMNFAHRPTKRVGIGATGYIFVGDNDDEINEYGFLSYGANFRANYEIDEYWFARGVLGASHSLFEVGPVFDDDSAVANPSGINIYGALDTGANLNIGTGWRMSPFAGIVADAARVAGDAAHDIIPRAGVGIARGAEENGIRYDYEIGMSAYASGDFDTWLRAAFLSALDRMGANIELGLSHNDIGFMYRVALGFDFMF